MLDGDGYDFRNEEEFYVGGEGGSLYPTIGLEQQLKQMSYYTLKSLQQVLDDEGGYSKIIDQYCTIYNVSDKILYYIIIYVLLQKKNNAFQAIDLLVGTHYYMN